VSAPKRSDSETDAEDKARWEERLKKATKAGQGSLVEPRNPVATKAPGRKPILRISS